MVGRGRVLAVLSAVAPALLAGCSAKRHSVVGTWDVQGGPTAASFSFQSDGQFKTEASGGGRSSSVTGPYKQEGDRLQFELRGAGPIGGNAVRTATIRWNSDDEIVMTGDDGVAMTLKRRK